MASNPRNKQIASIFKEAGIIEKYDSGIKRVRQSMAESGAPAPVFEIIAQSFKVTLFPSGGVSGGVNDLLTYIKDNPGKKSKEIKSALNLTQRTLERWLKELRIQNKIRFQGAPKTGGYFPVDDT
jgi:ATP-dependent DNA helicase RecG